MTIEAVMVAEVVEEIVVDQKMISEEGSEKNQEEIPYGIIHSRMDGRRIEEIHTKVDLMIGHLMEEWIRTGW